MAPPPLPAGYEKHHIVVLEAIHVPMLPFDFPHTITKHSHSEPDQIATRIKDATIVVSNIAIVRPEDMNQAPHMMLLAVMATGMGWVDKSYCASRRITVINCPQSNVQAVAEHFLTLYFASRKKVVEVHNTVCMSNEWVEKATLAKRVWPQGPPLGCHQEKLGIIGYGALGRKVEALARAVGFGEVLIGERKGAEKIRDGRVGFEEMLKSVSVIVVLCPKEPETINLIDESELRMMRKDCLLVNVARGGIVNEGALAKALKEGRIFGAATDVLDTEPGGPGSSPLIPDLEKGEEKVPNLIVSSHVAWYSGETITALQRLLKEGVEAFVAGGLDEDRIKGSVAVHEGRIWK